ncbi:hypothetical protein EVAR_90565_1 [Eumeta japonica]|uniref:Uncharacterized protein n=1 Tax=Eumeta variegata TaxID=151549 RepID=A0A4C1YR31_EUMVA|nr:hypothetical protein EVAR_90565_1 [Eumeta japonica]
MSKKRSNEKQLYSVITTPTTNNKKQREQEGASRASRRYRAPTHTTKRLTVVSRYLRRRSLYVTAAGPLPLIPDDIILSVGNELHQNDVLLSRNTTHVSKENVPEVFTTDRFRSAACLDWAIRT